MCKDMMSIIEITDITLANVIAVFQNVICTQQPGTVSYHTNQNIAVKERDLNNYLPT